MLNIDELDLSESFTTDTSTLWKDNLDFIELDGLDGELCNNRVVIELDSIMHEKIKTKTGLDLWVDNTYEIGTHSVRSGTIAKLPNRLIFWDEDDQNGLYWKTTIEAEVGNRVWASGMAIHSGEKIKIKDKLFVIVSYADLYVAKKQNGVVVCLNGNVLLKPILRTFKALSFERRYIDPDFAFVAYIGRNNTEYEADYMEDDPNIKQNMKVVISGIIPRRLEIAPYLEFDGDNEYLVCQAYEIQGWLS